MDKPDDYKKLEFILNELDKVLDEVKIRVNKKVADLESQVDILKKERDQWKTNFEVTVKKLQFELKHQEELNEKYFADAQEIMLERDRLRGALQQKTERMGEQHELVCKQTDQILSLQQQLNKQNLIF